MTKFLPGHLRKTGAPGAARTGLSFRSNLEWVGWECRGGGEEWVGWECHGGGEERVPVCPKVDVDPWHVYQGRASSQL